MRELNKAHQELIKIITSGIPNRQVFERQVKEIYLNHVYRAKYESDFIGEQPDPGKLDYKSKQWLGNAISLLVLRGYLGLVVRKENNETNELYGQGNIQRCA
jgi:hypothetical protein